MGAAFAKRANGFSLEHADVGGRRFDLDQDSVWEAVSGGPCPGRNKSALTSLASSHFSFVKRLEACEDRIFDFIRAELNY
jgi:hypothetical protein